MTRTIILFAAILFAALITGSQYVISWDYHPAGMSPSFYTEKMQRAIRVIGVPLFSVQIAAAILTLVSAILFRKVKPAFYFLAVAAAGGIAAVLLTRFGAIPLLDQIATWTIDSPPSNWDDIAMSWWHVHIIRFGIQVVTFALLLFAAFNQKDRTS